MASAGQSTRRIRDFAAALDGLSVRWRKTPPVRIEWYESPRRNTLPLLRYSVNPGKTMILKVMITPPEPDNHRPISVALFQIDGFMFDTSFGIEDGERAMHWLRRLFTEKSVVEVAEKNGEWAGSYCGRPKHPRQEGVPAFTRSWLGKYDTA